MAKRIIVEDPDTLTIRTDPHRAGMKISFEWASRKRILLGVGSNSVSVTLVGGRHELVIPPCIQIQVRQLPAGDTISMDVYTCYTVRNLKFAISDHTRIPPHLEQHQLIYHGQQLEDDDKALADYGIQDGSVLDFLDPRPVEICLQLWTGKQVLMDVYPTDTVKTLKEKILQRTGVDPNDHDLVFKNHQLVQDDGVRAGSVLLGTETSFKTLADCGITRGSTLTLHPWNIFVKCGSRTICLRVSSGERIEDICVDVSKRTAIPTRMFELIYNGKLLNRSYLLSVYGIPADSTLELRQFNRQDCSS